MVINAAAYLKEGKLDRTDQLPRPRARGGAPEEEQGKSMHLP